MKKLLFVTTSLENNGATISLENLLQKIDYTQYDIDLLLFDSTPKWGIENIPKSVHFLPEYKDIGTFWRPCKTELAKLWHQKKITLLMRRIQYVFGVFCHNRVKTLQHLFARCLPSLPKVIGDYDVAIAFQDYFPGVMMLEKVSAHKYIGWNHNVYSQMQFDDGYYEDYLNRLDVLATISELTRTDLISCFPNIAAKCKIVNNIINTSRIDALCNQSVTDMRFLNTTTPVILSIGRLSIQKGFDFAIRVAQKLHARGVRFQWFIIGEGELRAALERQIAHMGLENIVILLGQQTNPYSYLKQCTLYAQPSRFEGYGIALDEAYYLHKPILATMDVAERFQNEPNATLLPLEEDKWTKEILSLFAHTSDRKVDKVEKTTDFFNKGLEQFYQLLM